MLISEMIERLETLKFLHGDVELSLTAPDHSTSGDLDEIKEVFYEVDRHYVIIA